jgi:hypothetical protein
MHWISQRSLTGFARRAGAVDVVAGAADERDREGERAMLYRRLHV